MCNLFSIEIVLSYWQIILLISSIYFQKEARKNLSLKLVNMSRNRINGLIFIIGSILFRSQIFHLCYVMSCKFSLLENILLENNFYERFTLFDLNRI